MNSVTLRAPKPADARRLAIWENLDGQPDVSEADMLGFIKQQHTLKNNNQQRFVIDFEGVAAGTVDLTHPTANGLGAFVSIYIDERCRSRKIGSQALHLAVKQAIDFGLEQLGAIIKNDNLISQALFTSAGFVPVASYHDDPAATVWMLDIALRHV